jgi:WD40 repeat protein
LDVPPVAPPALYAKETQTDDEASSSTETDEASGLSAAAAEFKSVTPVYNAQKQQELLEACVAAADGSAELANPEELLGFLTHAEHLVARVIGSSQLAPDLFSTLTRSSACVSSNVAAGSDNSESPLQVASAYRPNGAGPVLATAWATGRTESFAAAYSAPDGGAAICVYHLADPTRPELILRCPYTITCLVFPSKNLILAGTDAGQLCLWDFRGVEAAAGRTRVAITPGALPTVTTRLYSSFRPVAQTGDVQQRITTPERRIVALSMEQYIATAPGAATAIAEDGSLSVWDPLKLDSSLLFHPPPKLDSSSSVRVSAVTAVPTVGTSRSGTGHFLLGGPSGALILAHSASAVSAISSTQDRTLSTALHGGGAVSSLCAKRLSDGNTHRVVAVSTGGTGFTRLWAVAPPATLISIGGQATPGPCTSVAWCPLPNSPVIATGDSTGLVALWDVSSMLGFGLSASDDAAPSVGELSASNSLSRCVAFSSVGAPVTSLAWRADGAAILVAAGDRVHLCPIAARHLPAEGAAAVVASCVNPSS